MMMSSYREQSSEHDWDLPLTYNFVCKYMHQSSNFGLYIKYVIQLDKYT